MDEDLPADPRRDPDPPDERVNHLAFVFLALVVMLIFWYGTG